MYTNVVKIVRQGFHGLQHHNDLRRQTDLWGVYQINVVEFLRNACGLADEFTGDVRDSQCKIIWYIT